jgi:hypothetical protein
MLDAAAIALVSGLLTRLGPDAITGVVQTKHDRQALERAVDQAMRRAMERHSGTFGRYDINPSFFKYEGADEIAKLLLPGVGARAANLASAAVRSLGDDDASHLADPLVVPFEDLLQLLVEELGRHSRFRTCLHEVAVTRPATPDESDEREFLRWIADHFESVNTAGLGAAQHLQLELREVFAEPLGVREAAAGRRWTSRSTELLAVARERRVSGELSAEDYEATLDRIEANQAGRPSSRDEPVLVRDVLLSANTAVILGDPGAGKTTLLRYLALTNADRLLRSVAGGSAVAPDARVPLYVRIGDFARSERTDEGLRGFIAAFLAGKLECPVDHGRLSGIVSRCLRSGRALVLLDGLDEVSSADARSTVVRSIADFADAERRRGNHILCTSRISGYLAAPLPDTFTVVRLLDMDTDAIRRFLHLYVPAIERAEAPTKSAQIVQRDARNTTTALLDAFRRSSGVRRLATNPLLLTVLLLVHRSMGALPERRVDAYKAVTDALGHTWRATQGVPARELPDERRLTQWLTRLAAWMHENRPEGSVGRRDLLRIWGPLLARLQREPWDLTVPDAADPASTEGGRAILEFVEQVERHSGLLVERAPGRWGFPHLTFEEFYAGRALAFEGRAAERPVNIRRRLHDARYDEPILLALGLIGSEQPEEIEALFEVSLLATGTEAQELGVQPSDFEDLLGRDFRFALRALADDIPARPEIIDGLIHRAMSEALDRFGLGRFFPYRAAVVDRIMALEVPTMRATIAQILADRRSEAQRKLTHPPSRSVRADAEKVFGKDFLVERLIDEENAEGLFSGMTSESLRHELTSLCAVDDKEFSVEERAHLLTLAISDDTETGPAALDALRQGSATLPQAEIGWLLDRALASGVRAEAARAILEAEPLLPVSATDRLITALEDAPPEPANWAALLVKRQRPLSKAAVARLNLLGSLTSRPEVSLRAGEAMDRESRSDSHHMRLVTLATDADPFVRLRARDLLSAEDQAAAWRAVKPRWPELLSASERVLVNTAAVLSRLPAKDADALAAAEAIFWDYKVLPIQAIDELIMSIARPASVAGALTAVRVLCGMESLPEDAAGRLEEIASTADPSLSCITAAQVLLAHNRWSRAISRAVERVASSRRVAVADVLGAMNLLATRNETSAERRRRLYDIAITTTNEGTLAVAARVYIVTAQLPIPLVDRLAIVASADRSYAAEVAVRTLAKQKELSLDAIATLEGVALSSESGTTLKLDILNAACGGQPSEAMIGVALQLLGDSDDGVHAGAETALVLFARHDPETRAGIMDRLAARIRDGMSEQLFRESGALESAYDVLWRISEGETGRTEDGEEPAMRLVRQYDSRQSLGRNFILAALAERWAATEAVAVRADVGDENEPSPS